MTAKRQPLDSAHPQVPRAVLQAEQARLLYAGIPVSLTVNAVIATILVIFLRNILDISPVTLWSALLGATLLLRAIFTVAYRQAPADELASTAWLTRFRIGIAATGIAWGMAGLLLFPDSHIPYQSLLALTVAGMTAGAVTSLSVDLVSSLAFIVPALTPLIIRLLAENEEIPVAMGTMGVLYLAALVLTAWRSHHEIIENISLHFEALAREEDLRIAAIAFESQEGIIVTDANGVIMRVNEAFVRLTGYSAKEVVGKTPALLNSGRQGKEFFDEMWVTLRQKKRWQGEIWNRRKNGKIYAEWLTISAVSAPDGKITHYVGTFSNITNDPEASAEIHRLAYYDPLTRLPNRRLLMDRLGQALASSQRSGRYGALLFMDLDNFKKLNDTRGHDVGDQLLIEIAKRLNACVREGDTVVRLGDTVVRLGGDEFVLMLEDLGANEQEAAIQAGHVGEKIRDAVALPCMLNGIEYSCTASIGISLFHGHNASVDDLLKYADLAMYHAKKGGRNRLSFFDPAMQTTLIEHSTLENDLRHALDRKQLRLYYQIQIDSEHRVAGAEALLRWQHPERGLMKPDKFVPLAEETGLIIPIGLWVLQNACAQLKAWSDDPATRDLQLAINVSVRQFHQPDFVAQVQQAIAAAGINPNRLKIELTESLVLDNVNDAITKMHALKALGVSFSMDDFGTGYSSLSNLQQLPLHQLKIDQSFVRDLTTNPNDAAIVQAIVTMGLAFGMNVIAEGVETEKQREFLDLLGCHAFQGYLFNQPMPANEFEMLIAQYA